MENASIHFPFIVFHFHFSFGKPLLNGNQEMESDKMENAPIQHTVLMIQRFVVQNLQSL
jgi:hypothetical protein